MKSRIPHALAALLVASAVPFALAQSDPQPSLNLAEEPVASVSRSEDLTNAIAQALLADPSLKDSKITVQPEDGGVILLTGVTRTDAQRRQAGSIAASHAGEGKVSNSLTTEELVMWAPPVSSMESEELAEPAAEPAAQEAPVSQPTT